MFVHRTICLSSSAVCTKVKKEAQAEKRVPRIKIHKCCQKQNKCNADWSLSGFQRLADEEFKVAEIWKINQVRESRGLEGNRETKGKEKECLRKCNKVVIA